MKNHILVLILLCYSLTTWSQQLPVDEISKKVSYSAVVESQGQMKNSSLIGLRNGYYQGIALQILTVSHLKMMQMET